MPTRIVTHAYRPKRPPRKRKAAPAIPAIVTRAIRRHAVDTPPVADEPKRTPPPPAGGVSTAAPIPAAKSAVVTSASRKRAKLHRAEPSALPDDPEAAARVKAFFARMIRPSGQ